MSDKVEITLNVVRQDEYQYAVDITLNGIEELDLEEQEYVLDLSSGIRVMLALSADDILKAGMIYRLGRNESTQAAITTVQDFIEGLKEAEELDEVSVAGENVVVFKAPKGVQ